MREKDKVVNVDAEALPSIRDSYSEEVNEIMTKMPPWLIRRGIGFLFVVVSLLLFGSYIIKYPDVVMTDVTISSSNPPIKIVSRVDSKIQKIFKRNNDYVSKNELICLINNPANYEDVLQIRKIITAGDSQGINLSNLSKILPNEQLQLGEMQTTYSALLQSFHQYTFFKRNNFSKQKIAQLSEQIKYHGMLDFEMVQKDSLLNKQLFLGNKKYSADSALAFEKIIAPLELDNTTDELITRQLNVQTTRSSILQSKIQRQEFAKTITDLQQQHLKQEHDFQETIFNTITKLKGELAICEQKYVVISPIDGRTLFFTIWKENQPVSIGETLLMVVPKVENFIAKANLPIDGAGKVQIGQKVLIKLRSFPFQEFGTIRGTVSQISSIPFDSAYALEIFLPDGLKTNLKRAVPPLPELIGTAEVVTSSRSLFERIFFSILAGFSR